MYSSPKNLLCLGLPPFGWPHAAVKTDLRGRNFGEEVARQQNLVFTFSHDLIADSLVDRWDSTEYVTFEPAVRGKFKWTSSNELMFSPTSVSGLVPITRPG